MLKKNEKRTYKRARYGSFVITRRNEARDRKEQEFSKGSVNHSERNVLDAKTTGFKNHFLSAIHVNAYENT